MQLRARLAQEGPPYQHSGGGGKRDHPDRKASPRYRASLQLAWTAQCDPVSANKITWLINIGLRF